jgi:hypothetical protein
LLAGSGKKNAIIILDFDEFLVAVSITGHKNLKKRMEFVFSIYGK